MGGLRPLEEEKREEEREEEEEEKERKRGRRKRLLVRITGGLSSDVEAEAVAGSPSAGSGYFLRKRKWKRKR